MTKSEHERRRLLALLQVLAILAAPAAASAATPDAVEIKQLVESPTDTNVEAFDSKYGDGATAKALTRVCIWGKTAFVIGRYPSKRANSEDLLLMRDDGTIFPAAVARGFSLACKR